MKRRKRVIAFLIMVTLAISSVLDVYIQNPMIAYAASQTWEDEVNLGLYDVYTLHAGKKGQKVTWSSSDKKIVTVSSKGRLKAVGYGEADVKAKVGKKTYVCKVNVLHPCIFDDTDKWICGDEMNSGSYIILSEGATRTIREEWGTATSYSSTNKKVATISKKGKIKALKSGVAKIVVKDKQKRQLALWVVVQRKNTKLIAPTAIQKKRMKKSSYISYNQLIKNNSYDKNIITDKIRKSTKLKTINNKKLPYFTGIVLENRGQICNFRQGFNMSEVYSGNMTADYVTEEEIKFQSENGFNCIRLCYSLSYLSDGSNTNRINETELQVLDEIVSWCMKYNMSLMLSIMEVPGYTKKTSSNSTNIGQNTSWMTDENVTRDMERYLALIAQRYASLPNSAVMFELEAEPSITLDKNGDPDMDSYCATNNRFADAIWKEKKDAVCIVSDIWSNYFPTACAEHGINVYSHSDGKPERVGDYYLVGMNTGNGAKYNPVDICYLPSIISDDSGPMVFEAEGGFQKQELYIGSTDGMTIMQDEAVSLVEVTADGTPLDVIEVTDTYIKLVIPENTKRIVIKPSLFDRVRVDMVRFGDLVIPAVNHYWERDVMYGNILKQPVITIHKDHTYTNSMYKDQSEWYYKVWMEDFDKLCKKYGVTFLRTEISSFVGSISGYNNPEQSYDTLYDLGANPDNMNVAISIISDKAKACKEHNISWMAWCTNDVFMPASQLTTGCIAIDYKIERLKEKQMTQWKNTGFWYLKPLIDELKKYQ